MILLIQNEDGDGVMFESDNIKITDMFVTLTVENVLKVLSDMRDGFIHVTQANKSSVFK